MFRKILVITLKVIITSVLIYSAFVILFISTFDLLSLSVNMSFKSKHSKKCTFYTLRFGCSFAAVNTIKPQLL